MEIRIGFRKLSNELYERAAGLNIRVVFVHVWLGITFIVYCFLKIVIPFDFITVVDLFLLLYTHKHKERKKKMPIYIT